MFFFYLIVFLCHFPLAASFTIFSSLRVSYAAFACYGMLVPNATTAHENPLMLYFPLDKWDFFDTLAAEIKTNFSTCHRRGIHTQLSLNNKSR